MEHGLTKENSKLLQGIAILIMLYHHLFCIPERLNTEYISILYFNNINIELKLAWFCKMCVAIYAFISGYGLYIVANKTQNNNILDKIIKDYKLIFKTLWNFYKQYWLVFAIFVPMGFIFFGREFNLTELVKNFIGISSSYNGEWWYVFQYIKMLIAFPIINAYFYNFNNRKITFVKILISVLVIIFIVASLKFSILKSAIFFVLSHMGKYISVFVVGFLFSKWNLYAKFYKFNKNHKINEIVMASVLLLTVVVTRTLLATSASYCTIDFVLVPFLIYSLIIVLDKKINLKKILNIFGKYSNYMWLTHTFFCYYYFQTFITFAKYSTLIYLWLIFVSLCVAWGIDKAYYMLGNLKTRSSKIETNKNSFNA